MIKIASDRCTDKWAKIRSPEINLHISGQFVFVKGATLIQSANHIIFNNANGTDNIVISKSYIIKT